MFRRFSLFDSSPPASRISINPPKIKDRKSPLKGAISNTLQLENSPPLIHIKPNGTMRSISLDNSAHLRILQSPQKQRHKSATLPPIINRQLPPPQPTTNHRWYNRLGNSFRRGAWRRPAVQYQVITRHVRRFISAQHFNLKQIAEFLASRSCFCSSQLVHK